MMDIKLRALVIFGIITTTLGWVEVPKHFTEILHPEILGLNLTITNRTIVNVHLNIVKDIPQMFLDVVVEHDSGDGNYDMVYMNKTIDLCMLLSNRKLNVFFDIVYRIFSDYADLPKKCPIRKKQYDVRNVLIDPEKFPPFMPDHKARVSTAGWDKQHGKKNILFRVICYAVIERSFKNPSIG